MSHFEIGDLVVLTAGSMRMAVETVDGDEIATVWCHEGIIGRDRFNVKLLKKFEFREDSGASKPPFRAGGSKPYGGDRPFRARESDGGGGYRGNKPDGEGGGYRGKPDHDGGGYRGKSDRPSNDAAPRGPTGWDGKPREKKYFRKDS